MSDTPFLPPAWLAIRSYRARRFGPQWIGVSDRSRATRLELLCAEKNGARVLRELAALSAAEIGQINALAQLNADQAEAAFRRGLVFNLTMPAGLLAGLAQMDPTLFAGLTAKFSFAEPRILAATAAMTLLLGVLFLSFISARDARDLADLVAIAKARAERGRPD